MLLRLVDNTLKRYLRRHSTVLSKKKIPAKFIKISNIYGATAAKIEHYTLFRNFNVNFKRDFLETCFLELMFTTKRENY